jgi:membrane fusion protein (multidrug efflux system)
MRARLEARRIRALIPDQAVSKQDMDNAVARERTALAQVARSEAAVQQASLDLSYTKIFAPEAGRITRKRVERGAYVQVGQTLFVIVPDQVWVVANYKETQLEYMRPGQPASIHVDAYPDKVFHGHVDSIQAGSGAAFSLLPPENATGNYVKVVQRVPVKIVIDDPPDDEHVLGPGMSVVPEIQVR